MWIICWQMIYMKNQTLLTSKREPFFRFKVLCHLLQITGGTLRVKIIIPLFFGLKNLICPSLRPFIAVHGTEVAELKSFQPITENVLLNSEMPGA